MLVAERIARFRELDRLIAGQDPIVGRVLDNASERARESRRERLNKKPTHYEPRMFANLPARHPLDKRFRCGFDPLNVTIKQYRVHISNCQNQDCIERHHRWLDLMEYFR